MKNTFLALLAAASLALFAPAPRAEPQSPPTNFDRVQRADGARVVPEKFLRDWDPVTVFFDSDAGPKNGGPADAHEKFATLSPEPAGEWRWLGPRALQFRPAEPWTPLARVVVKSGSSETRLVALLPTPSSTTPADGADPIPELTQIALTFPFAGRSEGAGALARHRDTALAGRIKARRAGAVIGRFRHSSARAKQALRRAKLCHKISRGHRRRPTRGHQAEARGRARLRRGNLRAARAHGDAFRRRRHDLRPRLERRQDRRRAALRVEWRRRAGARERRGRGRRRGLAIRAGQQAAPVAAIFRRARAARYLTRARSAARHAARRRSQRRGRPPAPEDHGQVFIGSRLRAEHRAGRAA